MNYFRKFVQTLNQTFWRRLTNFWTIIFFILIIQDFLTDNAVDKSGLILLVAAFYTATLAIYSAEKEFKRWYNCNDSMHPGEIYVILWTVLVFGLTIANLYFKFHYELPAEVRATYIVVIGVLALTKESKHLYKKRAV